MSGILSIRDQLTFQNYVKIQSQCGINKISLASKLYALENDKKYWSGKKSLYATLNNWTKSKNK